MKQILLMITMIVFGFVSAMEGFRFKEKPFLYFIAMTVVWYVATQLINNLFILINQG